MCFHCSHVVSIISTLGQLSQQLKDNQVDQLVFSESEHEAWNETVYHIAGKFGEELRFDELTVVSPLRDHPYIWH